MLQNMAVVMTILSLLAGQGAKEADTTWWRPGRLRTMNGVQVRNCEARSLLKLKSGVLLIVTGTHRAGVISVVVDGKTRGIINYDEKKLKQYKHTTLKRSSVIVKEFPAAVSESVFGFKESLEEGFTSKNPRFSVSVFRFAVAPGKHKLEFRAKHYKEASLDIEVPLCCIAPVMVTAVPFKEENVYQTFASRSDAEAWARKQGKILIPDAGSICGDGPVKVFIETQRVAEAQIKTATAPLLVSAAVLKVPMNSCALSEGAETLLAPAVKTLLRDSSERWIPLAETWDPRERPITKAPSTSVLLRLKTRATACEVVRRAANPEAVGLEKKAPSILRSMLVPPPDMETDPLAVSASEKLLKQMEADEGE